MKFTRSRDGQMRATVKITFRVSMEEVAHLIALDIRSQHISYPDRLARLPRSRTALEKMIRDNKARYGDYYGEQGCEDSFGLEVDIDAETFESLMSEGYDCAKDLFPELRDEETE